MTDRPVTTDALATLGTIIDETAARDAIHIAVLPVVAGHALYVGSPVAFLEKQPDGAYIGYAAAWHEAVGIVDPFLRQHVNEGERFWMLILPRTITSLRHVWSHPKIDDAAAILPPAPAPALSPDERKAASEKWLRDFVARSNCPDYWTVLVAAVRGTDSVDDDYMHFDGQDAHGSIPSEFWEHVEIVTG